MVGCVLGLLRSHGRTRSPVARTLAFVLAVGLASFVPAGPIHAGGVSMPLTNESSSGPMRMSSNGSLQKLAPVRDSNLTLDTSTPCTTKGVGLCSTLSSDPSWDLDSAAVHPSPRYGAMMAYDSADGYTVLFGGYEGFARPFHDFNDTWIFRSGIWTQISPPLSPPAREFGVMADDPATGCLVLFGGATLTGEAFNDTWTFCHGLWTNVTPSHSPEKRFEAAMASDPACSCLVLFGGASVDGASFGDTWEFEDRSWIQLNTNISPPGQVAAAMAFDPSAASIVLFTGLCGNNYCPNNTWAFENQTWTELFPASAPPFVAWGDLVSLPAPDGVLLFGGENNSAYNDTWVFRNGDWTNDSGGTAPEERSTGSAAYDWADGYVVIFGGYNDFDFPTQWFGDTWTYGGVVATFTEVGLPTGQTWTVDMNGTLNYSTTAGMSFILGWGTFSFTLPPAIAQGGWIRFTAETATGLLSVASSPIITNESYREQAWIHIQQDPPRGGFATPTSNWEDVGIELNLSAFPASGYRFVTWLGNGTGNYSGPADPAPLTITLPVNETAIFSPDLEFSIVFNESGLPEGTSWSVNLNGVTSTSNRPTLMMMVPNGTYTWAIPAINGTSTGTRFDPASPFGYLVVGGSEMALGVRFVPQVLLLSSASPDGWGLVLPNSSWVDTGVQVTLVAVPLAGHSFQGWSGNGTGAYSGPAQIENLIPEAPLEEVAHFGTPGSTSPSNLSTLLWTLLISGVGGLIAGTVIVRWRRRGRNRPQSPDAAVRQVIVPIPPDGLSRWALATRQAGSWTLEGSAGSGRRGGHSRVDRAARDAEGERAAGRISD